MSDLTRDLAMIQRCARKYWDSRFADYGFRGSQHPYLTAICRQPGISQEQLAKQTETHKSRVARQLTSLEEAGYIIRSVSPQDRRITQVYPTDKALEVMPAIRDCHNNWRDILTQGMTEEETAVLSRLLGQMRSNAEAFCLPEENGEPNK